MSNCPLLSDKEEEFTYKETTIMQDRTDFKNAQNLEDEPENHALCF
ncbi:MAG: hypothetical protein H7308_06390 [Chthonomonadaceae bacterium]|nr:hypothetical protein [Chthonomonadaceae bacterium]